MPGRFANLKAYFSGKAWSNDLGRDLDEVLADIVQASNAAQGIPGTPTAIQAGVDPSPGTLSGTEPLALDDHQHNISTAPSAGLANANSEGSSFALMRADAGIKRDVRVKKAGADVGTRNALNFVDTGSLAWTVTDNPGADRVDISATASGSGGADVNAQFLALLAISMGPA